MLYQKFQYRTHNSLEAGVLAAAFSMPRAYHKFISKRTQLAPTPLPHVPIFIGIIVWLFIIQPHDAPDKYRDVR